jgi:hypothetical protein
MLVPPAKDHKNRLSPIILRIPAAQLDMWPVVRSVSLGKFIEHSYHFEKKIEHSYLPAVAALGVCIHMNTQIFWQNKFYTMTTCP